MNRHRDPTSTSVSGKMRERTAGRAGWVAWATATKLWLADPVVGAVHWKAQKRLSPLE